jgi:hypothetical protein
LVGFRDSYESIHIKKECSISISTRDYYRYLIAECEDSHYGKLYIKVAYRFLRALSDVREEATCPMAAAHQYGGYSYLRTNPME